MSTRTKEQQQAQSSEFSRDQQGEAAKIERIAGQTAGLVEDLKSWFELKLEFVQLEIKDEIKAATTPYLLQGVSLIIVLIAVLFGLAAAAYGLGEWLGHPAWGFLSVFMLLMLAAFLVKIIGDRSAGKAEEKKTHTYDATTSQHKLPETASKRTTKKLESPALEAEKEQKMLGLSTQNHGKDQ